MLNVCNSGTISYGKKNQVYREIGNSIKKKLFVFEFSSLKTPD